MCVYACVSVCVGTHLHDRSKCSVPFTHSNSGDPPPSVLFTRGITLVEKGSKVSPLFLRLSIHVETVRVPDSWKPTLGHPDVGPCDQELPRGNGEVPCELLQTLVKTDGVNSHTMTVDHPSSSRKTIYRTSHVPSRGYCSLKTRFYSYHDSDSLRSFFGKDPHFRTFIWSGVFLVSDRSLVDLETFRD